MTRRLLLASGEPLPLLTDEDVVRARHHVRELAQQAGLRLVEQTKLVTAVSELARNAIIHGGGGRLYAERVSEGARHGVVATFEDDGPGIPDIQLALTDGFSTGTGLGLGFGGARRLVNEFEARPNPTGGTIVRVATWR
jgi:serine/threonine-protein kinase RsbT